MNKLQQVRYAAGYTALAQKLDMHMKNFDSDNNTQIRWVWELIQNAKDAPNRFKQTKIRQSLDDGYFISSHNGDAFEIPQLHSIVAQYSTKKQKNSQSTKTTGKYGTGFITTYILSKFIELSAILKVEIQQDSDDEYQKGEIKNQRSKINSNKNKIQEGNYNPVPKSKQNSLNDAFCKLSTDDSNEGLAEFQNRTNYHFKESSKLKKPHENQKSVFYYKRFTIPMDRSYIDRDQELPKKIEKAQKRLTKIVSQAQYESTHNPDFSVRDYEQTQRTVDSYDTEFRYKITDKRKFEMIETTLVNLKALLPYAFLFNDNLTYYEFIDNRKFRQKDFSFSLTKGQLAEIGPNICLFTYQVQEGYDQKKQSFEKTKIGYIVSYFSNGRAIAAVPVHIEQSGIEILRVDNKLPKYFKDFPLIGCSDLKCNALINSREFYPNEKRSELMLDYIDETNKQKVQTNWVYLRQCSIGIKEIYLFLSHHCKSGLENLLIFSNQNMVAEKKLQFKNHLLKLIKEITSAKIIPNRLHEADITQRATQPRNLVFIELASHQSQIYKKDKKSHLELSFRANQAFAFLYGNEKTISTEHYAAFYDILNYSTQYRAYLQSCKLIRFVTVNQCLDFLSKKSFQDFCVLLKGNYAEKLHEIYSLLRDYNESAYLSLSSKEKFFDYAIFLNQNNEFKCLRSNHMMFNNLPKVYEQLAKFLEIDIKQTLIHEQFRKYIKQTDPQFSMDILKMQNQIITHFSFNKISIDEKKNLIYGLEYLLTLLKLLVTFKCISDQTLGLVKRFVDFEKIIPFAFTCNTNELHKFRTETEKKLLQIFTNGFTIYFQSKTLANTQLKNLLSTCLNIRYFDEAVDFLKDLMKDNLLGSSLGSIPVKLAWNGIFTQQLFLCKLNKDVEYPDWVDIQIYYIVFNLKGPGLFSRNDPTEDRKLQQRLVHPLYPQKANTPIKNISYQQLYKVLQKRWTYSTEPTQMHQILTYISQINHNYRYGTSVDKTTRQKYETWKQDIEKRLDRLFELKTKSGDLKQERIKQFLYRLIDNKQELKNAQLIYQNNNNNLYFTTLCQQLNLLPNNAPKMQQPKPQAKK